MEVNGFFRKMFIVGLILLFIMSSMIPFIAENTDNPLPTVKGMWLYVGGSGPGNYTKIQIAIDDASIGDTIFVYPGVYYENIRIQKKVRVIGQNRTTTVIDGNKTGIVINITADFVNITGFTIQNDGGERAGGIVINANEATITKNIITNNSFGIRINYFTKNENIDLPHPYNLNPDDCKGFNHSNFNTIENNTLLYNNIGVMLSDTSFNVIAFNTFRENGLGGCIFPGSSFNAVYNNTFYNDGLFVLNNTYGNFITNNSVNGKPLLYLDGQSNKVITEKMGQIILVRCHNITINEQDITNTSFGVELIETTHCTISENIVRSNTFVNIFLYQCNDNILVNNTVGNDSYQGIFVWGINNMIAHNNITLNIEDGLHLYHSRNNTIVDNIISNNNHDGIHFEVSYADDRISGNTINQNKNSGMYLCSCENVLLFKNNITSNTNYGINIDYSTNLTIKNNTISHHFCGIEQMTSTNNHFLGNIITANSVGIQFTQYSDDNIISGNNIIFNNTGGIGFLWSNSNIISNNTIIENNRSGIVLWYSCNNLITKNTISWVHNIFKSRNGINISHSSNNTINDNTIVNATSGVLITEYSHNNAICQNHISKSIVEAIKCDSSSSNTNISTNSLIDNAIGLSLYQSDSNTIIKNAINHNTNSGIDISFASHNCIYNNTIAANADGVVVGFLTNYTIFKENIIMNNRRAGLHLMPDAKENTITDNIVNNNTLGINISGDVNDIYHNIISNNSLGILISYGSKNDISSNSFLMNNKHASFKMKFSNGRNTWEKNYWNRPQILPHLIFGKIIMNKSLFALPWFNVDWHPAKNPYELPEVG